MITKKLFKTINELQEVQRIATHCPDDVAFHSLVMLVSENEKFHKQIADIAETIE